MADVMTDALQGQSRWTLVSGLVTLALAVVAFFLPEIDLAPRGGIVGWLLFVAGCIELAFGTRRGRDYIGGAAVSSGILTAAAGLIFIFNPLAGYFSVANIVTAWLLVRGALVFAAALAARRSRAAPWLALSGGADLLLSFVLLAGFSTSVLVVTLFGATPAIVARFSLILAASFLFTGISQVAIALLVKGAERPAAVQSNRSGLRTDE